MQILGTANVECTRKRERGSRSDRKSGMGHNRVQRKKNIKEDILLRK